MDALALLGRPVILGAALFGEQQRLSVLLHDRDRAAIAANLHKHAAVIQKRFAHAILQCVNAQHYSRSDGLALDRAAIEQQKLIRTIIV